MPRRDIQPPPRGAVGQAGLPQGGDGTMADSEVFTDATGQGAGLVVSTGILGDLVLPANTFDRG